MTLNYNNRMTREAELPTWLTQKPTAPSGGDEPCKNQFLRYQLSSILLDQDGGLALSDILLGTGKLHVSIIPLEKTAMV
jgi:hypothetical protein